jgi:LacI family transcriptional regulator
MSGRKPTVHDVATRCGVSTATVSRVLSHADYPVSEALRRQVLTAAEELHYTPNLFGKYLKTSKSRDLGVIIPNIANPYYAVLLQGIYDVALKAEYHVILCNAYRDAKQETKSIRALLAKQVGGILLASINPDQTAVEEAVRYGCPVVAMEQAVPAPCIQVGFDYRQGGYLATQHLVDHGHRRIGFIGRLWTAQAAKACWPAIRTAWRRTAARAARKTSCSQITSGSGRRYTNSPTALLARRRSAPKHPARRGMSASTT